MTAQIQAKPGPRSPAHTPTLCALFQQKRHDPEEPEKSMLLHAFLMVSWSSLKGVSARFQPKSGSLFGIHYIDFFDYFPEPSKAETGPDPDHKMAYFVAHLTSEKCTFLHFSVKSPRPYSTFLNRK